MSDPPRSPEIDEHAGRGHDRGPAGSTPRWVFVLGIIIAVALVVLIVLLHLTGTLGPGAH
jgi:hypothetical protein